MTTELGKEAGSAWRLPANLKAVAGLAGKPGTGRLEALVAAKSKLGLGGSLPGVESRLAGLEPSKLPAATGTLTKPPEVLFRGHPLDEGHTAKVYGTAGQGAPVHASPFLDVAGVYGRQRLSTGSVDLVSTYQPHGNLRYYPQGGLLKNPSSGRTMPELFSAASSLRPRGLLSRLKDAVTMKGDSPQIGAIHIANRDAAKPGNFRFGLGAFETDVAGMKPNGRHLVVGGQPKQFPVTPANDAFAGELFKHAGDLPAITIDRPKGFKKTFTTPSGPKEVTYPMDYGYFNGVTNPQDGEGADVFVGAGKGKLHGRFMKGSNLTSIWRPDEHKWYTGLTPREHKTLMSWWSDQSPGLIKDHVSFKTPKHLAADLASLNSTKEGSAMTPFAEAFFARCTFDGIDRSMMKAAVDRVVKDFPEAEAELRLGLEKIAGGWDKVLSGGKTALNWGMSKAAPAVQKVQSAVARPAVQATTKNLTRGVATPAPTGVFGGGSGVPGKPENWGHVGQAARMGLGAVEGNDVANNMGGPLNYMPGFTVGGDENGQGGYRINPLAAGFGAAMGHNRVANSQFGQTMRRPFYNAVAGDIAGRIGDRVAGAAGYDTDGRLAQMGSWGGLATGFGNNAAKNQWGAYQRARAVGPLPAAAQPGRVGQFFHKTDDALNNVQQGFYDGGTAPARWAWSKMSGTPYRSTMEGAAPGMSHIGRRIGQLGAAVPTAAGVAGGVYSAATNHVNTAVNQKINEAYRNVVPAVTEQANQFMQDKGLLNEQGKFSPLGAMGHQVGDMAQHAMAPVMSMFRGGNGQGLGQGQPQPGQYPGQQAGMPAQFNHPTAPWGGGGWPGWLGLSGNHGMPGNGPQQAYNPLQAQGRNELEAQRHTQPQAQPAGLSGRGWL